MVPAAMLMMLIAGGMVVGTFLKLFADHRAFRRELRETKDQLETMLDIISTVAIDAGDQMRLDRIQRRLRGSDSSGAISPTEGDSR